MKILKAPPLLQGERDVRCSNCACEFSVVNDDVLYVNADDNITVENLPHGIFVDYKKRIASGFRYTVRCPICEIRTSISDHLTNFRVVQGSSGW